MDTNIKLFKFGWRLWVGISLRRVVEVRGVNSRIDEKTHFLMWDFDDTDLIEVKRSLRAIQARYYLPAVHIVSTGKEGGYHAYCFKACTWVEARTIIAGTSAVDDKYLAVGIGRGYFTLRFSDVPGREFKQEYTLPSAVAADVDYSSLACMVSYTKAR